MKVFSFDIARQVDGRPLVLVQGSARGRQPPRIGRGGLGGPQAPPASKKKKMKKNQILKMF